MAFFRMVKFYDLLAWKAVDAPLKMMLKNMKMFGNTCTQPVYHQKPVSHNSLHHFLFLVTLAPGGGGGDPP